MTQLGSERLALARPHGAALAAAWPTIGSTSAQGTSTVSVARRRQHVRLPRHQLERDVAGEPERRLQLPQARRDQARTLEVYRDPPAGPRRILRPARLHRHVTAVELPPEPLAQITLERREIGRELGGEIEVAGG